MASVNKVTLVGNLGNGPDFHPAGADNSAICNISISTTNRWKDRNSGTQNEDTEWHRVVFYGKLAEIAGEYLKKAVLFT